MPRSNCRLWFIALVLTLLFCRSWEAALGAATRVVSARLGDAEPLPRLIYGFNCDLVAVTAFENITFGGPELEAAVRDLRPASLRFPGGTTSNNYLWRTDSFSEARGDLTGWAGQQIGQFRRIGRRYDLPGYVRLCRQLRLEPIWVLNVYEESPESVAAMIQQLDRQGLDLRAIEMANEPYWDPRSLNDVGRYIALCKPLAAAVHRAKPGLKVGACFGPLQKTGYNYRRDWNAVLAGEKWFDAIVFHDYYGGQGIALEKGQRLPADVLLRPEAFLDEPVAELAKQVPGKPIWFTEWNLGSEALKQWKDTGAELLFLGATCVGLVKHRGTIERAMFHQIFEKGFGTCYFDAASRKVETCASYEFFRLLGTTFAGADRLRPIAFPDETLLGFATEGPDGVRLFLVNRGPESCAVTLPPEFKAPLLRLTISCPLEEKLMGGRARPEALAIAGPSVPVPPYSISVIGPSTLQAVPATAARELFPVRPTFLLWHPPYAAEQPQVDETGAYTIDLAKWVGKPMVVVKMNLKPLGLQAGGTYAVSFEAKAEPNDALIVNLPENDPYAESKEAAKPRNEWYPLTAGFRELRVVFKYDPRINDGQLSFFFDKKTVARGGRFVLRNFRCVSRL